MTCSRTLRKLGLITIQTPSYLKAIHYLHTHSHIVSLPSTQHLIRRLQHSMNIRLRTIRRIPPPAQHLIAQRTLTYCPALPLPINRQ
jgi:hypothetical protein